VGTLEGDTGVSYAIPTRTGTCIAPNILRITELVGRSMWGWRQQAANETLLRLRSQTQEVAALHASRHVTATEIETAEITFFCVGRNGDVARVNGGRIIYAGVDNDVRFVVSSTCKQVG